MERLRDVFSDHAVRQGRAGELTFYASENGRVIGTSSPSGIAWQVDGSLRDRHYCPGCDGELRWTKRQVRTIALNGSVEWPFNDAVTKVGPLCSFSGHDFVTVRGFGISRWILVSACCVMPAASQINCALC